MTLERAVAHITHLGVFPHLHLRKRNLRRDHRPTIGVEAVKLGGS